MKINKKVIIISTAIAVVGLTSLVAVSALTATKKASASPAEEKVYSVQVIDIRQSNNDIFLSYAGMIQPSKTEQVNFATIGEIKKIYFKEGDNVKKGQPLVALDDTDARRRQDSALQSMKAAEASKNSSKTTLDAAQRAYDTNGQPATQAQLDDAQKAVADATAQRDTAKADLDRINALCQPKRDAATVAQQKANDAQMEYDSSVAVYNAAVTKDNAKQAEIDAAKAEIPQAPAKIAQLETEKIATAQEVTDTQIASVNAKTNLDTKNNESRQAQIDLITEETTLQKTQKETQLQGLETQVVTRQGDYDRLKAQGGGDKEALKSQLDTATYAHDSASSSYESAKTNYEAATEAVEKCVYKAKEDGFIVKIVGVEGGIATPLAPILVVGSFDMVAQFGVSQTDVRDLVPNLSAEVIVNGETYAGTVKDVAVMPDETTRTYITNVSVKNAPRDLYLGEIATVNIALGERNGVWLPLSVVLNDGQDYVYTVEENRATRKNIKIVDVNNDLVRVTGLEDGGRVISLGMKTVKSGNLVSVVE